MAFENIFKGLNINKVENYTIDNNKKNVINNNFNYSDLEDINYNSIESVNEENNISDINAAIVDLKEQGFVKELEEKIVQLKLQKEALENDLIRAQESRSVELNQMVTNSESINQIDSQIESLLQQIKDIDSQISDLEQSKIAFMNYLQEMLYKSLVDNSDFDSYSQLDLSEEEAHNILTLILALQTASPTADQITAYDILYGNKSYEEIKSKFESDGLDMYYPNIDWDLVKSAYEKGFSFYELALLDESKGTQALNYIWGFLSTADQNLSYNINRLEFMTSEEKEILLYLYQNENAETANDYFKFKENEINSRIGMYNALEFLSTIDVNDPSCLDYIETVLKGLDDGIDNFWQGIITAGYGFEDTLLPEQYEAMYIINGISREQLQSIDFLTAEQKEQLMGLSENNLLTAHYEISSSIGNMLPAMAVSTAVSLVATPAAGSWTGSALMGISAGANSAQSAYLEGASYWQSIFYGTLSGTSEAVLGHYLGKIPGLSNVSNNIIIDLLGEGAEESLQAILDPYFQTLVLGKEYTINWNEVAKSGIYGMITAGILNGGQMVINGVNININNIDTETIEIIFAAEQKGIEVDYAQINNPEYINKLKNKNIQCVSNASFRYNSVEDNLIEVIRRHNLAYPEGDALLRLNNFVDPNSENYGNYNLITSSNSARYILKMYTPEQIAIALNNLKNGDLGSVFGNSATFDYGVDQGGIESLCKYKYVGPTLTVTIGDQNYILKDGVEYSYRFATMIYNELENRQQTKVEFVKIAYSKEYVYLKDKLISLGFSNRDASIILSSINDAGACSYAATANEIFACFIGREAEFEQKFGYPMFKIENGKKVLNSNELLLDLYVYCNKKSNGGRFILDDNTLNREFINYNKTDVFGRNLLKAKKQEYMSSIYGKSVNNISSFLRSKGVSYSSATLFTNPHAMLVSNSDFSNIIATMNEYMQYGCVFSMDIFQVRDENSNIVLGNTINMYSTNPNVYSSTSTATWNEGGGHAVFITGIGTDCFYVSSWGKEYSIPFSDLQNGGVFNIYWTQIK